MTHFDSSTLVCFTFAQEIMPEFFSTSRLASIQRQLNLYGFQVGSMK